jgi:uncharacterized protein (DUF302 family)
MRAEAFVAEVRGTLDDVEARVRELLAREGFGVLTEIPVHKVLEEKLGVSRSPLKILGACNPQLAHRALETLPEAALLLPCNVVLEETGGGGDSVVKVSIADPRSLLEDDRVSELAREAAARLQRVASELTEGTASPS